MISRRKLLAAVGGGLALSVMPTARPRRAVAAALPEPAVRRLVIVKLPGGIDTILTAEPRTRREAEPEIDVPYAASAIVEAGNLRLGPHFAPLAPFVDRMIILRGVGVRSVQHPFGERVVNAFKSNVAFRASLLRRPSFAQVVAKASGHGRYLEGGFFSPGFLDLLANKGRQAQVLQVLEDQASATRGEGIAGFVDNARALVQRIHAAPPATYGDPAEHWSRLFDATAWALEHDVARTIAVDIRDGDNPFPWDTHANNLDRQALHSNKATALLSRFLQRLIAAHAPGSSRPLLDDTVVVVLSELGRFPVLNDGLGKDHYPEIPVLLIGGGLAFASGGRALGFTNRRMQAQRISFTTGKDTPRGGELMTIDDLGTTLLEACGIARPELYGYVGRRLAFLRA